MGQNDLTQKNLILYPDVFADIINALFHDGHKIVREEELCHAPTESFYHAIDGKLKNQIQDVVMYVVKENQVRICYMLENQMRVERRYERDFRVICELWWIIWQREKIINPVIVYSNIRRRFCR